VGLGCRVHLGPVRRNSPARETGRGLLTTNQAKGDNMGYLYVKWKTGHKELVRFRTIRGARAAAREMNENATDHQLVYAIVFKEPTQC